MAMQISTPKDEHTVVVSLANKPQRYRKIVWGEYGVISKSRTKIDNTRFFGTVEM